ncbi:sensor histidine kinase [Halorarius litoreus]|uniref:sensor histidine kinase n=1 Tax=Halorarius litoreus TaxID=2962676 RepID=UPI0020CD0944|nr:HAMP domain-containing sensor histidine kinase [Halorarius litoreus]
MAKSVTSQIRRVGRMFALDDPRYPRVGVVYSITAAFIILGANGFLLAAEQSGNELAKFLGLLLLAAPVVYGMQRLLPREDSVETFDYVVGVGLGFCLYGMLVAAIVVTGHLLGEGSALDASFVILTGGLGGLVVGLPVGYGYGSLLTAKQEVQTQLRRNATVTMRISVLHRALRHNIRTHVNVAVGHLELLDETLSTAETRQHLETARRHLDRLESLSNNANRLKRIWSVQEYREPTPIRELVVEGLEAVAERYPTAEVDIQVATDARVVCHPFAHWAIEEAVRNALLHNDPATTSVTVQAYERDDHVVVEVNDDGRGIPDLETSVLQRPEETPLAHGLGLGMQVIYWVLRESGGTVEFSERVSGGTRVSMWFPTDSNPPHQ